MIPRARDVMAEIYRPLYLNQPPLVFTSRRTSELIKYAANAFLATKIAFINEIADLCEKVGADVQDVARGIGLDNRIGSKFLHAGPGYGGSCFPKDTMALIKTAQNYDAPLRIVETVAAVNETRKRGMAERVIAACGDNVAGKTSPSSASPSSLIPTICARRPRSTSSRRCRRQGLMSRRMIRRAWSRRAPLMPGVEFCSDAYLCATGAQALVIITEWEAFRALDLARIKSLLAEPIIVDLRNIYRPEDMRRRGFTYVSVGRA